MKQRTLFISRLSILLAMTIIVQMVGLPQPVTGPLVNMILILCVLILNVKAAIVIGVLTPLIALWRGQLPALLAPMVPFIILGNSLLVLIFGICRTALSRLKINLYVIDLISLACSSLIKFLVLWSGAAWFVPLIFGRQFSPQLIFMMSTPQFITAFIGGLMALFGLKLLKRFGVNF